MHVVQLVCSGAFAGVERYVLTAAEGLAPHCRVTVVGGDPTVFPDRLSRSGVAWLPGSTIPEARRSLARVSDIDILNTHMTDADTLGALVRPKGARVVSTRHFAAPRGGSVPARVVSRLASTRIAGQIAISDFVAGRIESESVVIHTGVATVADVPSGARENAVLVLQRLEAEKFTDDALRAWSLSGARAQGWRLWIAGDGGERRRLESLAAELGIGGTTDFLGFARDTGDLYRRASVLLAPTRVEGLGLSVIEAMAHGLPVVATDAGGHRETVGPVAEAALYPAGDAAAAAEELDRLVADAALRGRYGAALRDRQRTEFTIDAQITRTLDVYRRIV